MREKNNISKRTKMLKNTISIIGAFFCLCICFGLLVPEKASAKKVSSTLKNGTFTISGKGKMPKSAMPKTAQKKKIKKIIIKKGVTELPEDAFRDCSKATVITIASSVNKIGAMAFYNTGVKKITFPENPATLTLGYGVLHNCKKLQEITIPGRFGVTRPKKAANRKNLVGSLILGNSNSNIVKKVKFSTNLLRECYKYLGDCKNFEVLASDFYYKSIDGCIYTRDGKKLVVVPYGKKEIDIAEGCEVVDTQSYTYASDVYIDGKYTYNMYRG